MIAVILAFALAQSRTEAVASPLGDQSVYATLCYDGENCEPEAVVLNAAGAEVQRFRFDYMEQQGNCQSVMAIDWSVDGIGIDCHRNPSLSYYLVYDPKTGKPRKQYRGAVFTRSPDGRRVAYRGFQPHFGPPFAKSDTLDVDGRTLYPAGGSHLVSGDPDDPRIWRGIHEFQTPLQWSPDSRSIAFIERTFDFHSVGDCLVGCPESAFLNERWWAVVLDLSGKVRREEVKKGATMVWAPEARRFRVQ